MSNSAYEKPGTYTIYVIHATDDAGCGVVYVGRTRSRDLRRVLRYHREGRKRITAEDFSKELSVTPQIHVLSIIENCTASCAYRHNLAWYRHFDENGYDTLASEEFDFAAYTMQPETWQIYQEIKNTEIHPLLEQPYIPPKKKNDEIRIDDEHDEKMVQLNLKVKESVHKAFSSFCRSNNMVQREAFSVLLSNSSDGVAAKIIQEQSRTIRDQLAEIKKLKELPRGAKADIRLKQALVFTKMVISRYLELMFPESTVAAPLKCVTWDSFVKMYPDRTTYDYPSEDGFFIMELEALCYGKGRYSAVFIWGKDIESGCYRKLRYYPKREYVGLSLPKSPYLHRGVFLLVGYRIAPDNAADLYAALPVIDNSSHLWSQAVEALEKERRSLDEIIQHSQV